MRSHHVLHSLERHGRPLAGGRHQHWVAALALHPNVDRLPTADAMRKVEVKVCHGSWRERRVDSLVERDDARAHHRLECVCTHSNDTRQPALQEHYKSASGSCLAMQRTDRRRFFAEASQLVPFGLKSRPSGGPKAQR